MPAPKKVNPQNETRDEATEGGIGLLSEVLNGPVAEVEVDRVQESPNHQGPKTVVVRVNENIEDMSYVAGGRTERYTFEVGNRYRVPVYIAAELEALGKVWH